MSLIVLYFLHSTSVLSFYIDVVFTLSHYFDVIMTTMASQITSLTVIYWIVYSDADQRKHQSSAWLAFVRGIHRDRWIPRTKDQLRGKCFHLMTSSCIIYCCKCLPRISSKMLEILMVICNNIEILMVICNNIEILMVICNNIRPVRRLWSYHTSVLDISTSTRAINWKEYQTSQLETVKI